MFVKSCGKRSGCGFIMGDFFLSRFFFLLLFFHMCFRCTFLFCLFVGMYIIYIFQGVHVSIWFSFGSCKLSAVFRWLNCRYLPVLPPPPPLPLPSSSAPNHPVASVLHKLGPSRRFLRPFIQCGLSHTFARNRNLPELNGIADIHSLLMALLTA